IPSSSSSAHNSSSSAQHSSSSQNSSYAYTRLKLWEYAALSSDSVVQNQTGVSLLRFNALAQSNAVRLKTMTFFGDGAQSNMNNFTNYSLWDVSYYKSAPTKISGNAAVVNGELVFT